MQSALFQGAWDILPEFVMQSLVSGVDMEDLGVRSCATPFKNSPAEQTDFSEDLKQYVKVVSAQTP